MRTILKPLFSKPAILIVGCGDIGRRLLPSLTPVFKVFALTSQPEKAHELRLAGAFPIVGNLDQRDTLKRLTSLASIVIHLAPPNSTGDLDLRTKSLLSILSQGGRVRRFVYISTSGVYGDFQGAWVSEVSPTLPTSDRGQRRLHAEQQIRAWAIRAGVNASILRVPGIYASNRLPIERLKAGTPALVDQEDVYTNHIHAHDLAKLIELSIFRGRPQRLINASDNSHLKMGEYFDMVAKYYDLPKPSRVSKEELKGLVTPIMLSFMQESRRLRNDRIAELGYALRYPTVESFLKEAKKNLA